MQICLRALLLLLLFTLTGCYTAVNPREYHGLINQPRTLESPYFIMQDREISVSLLMPRSNYIQAEGKPSCRVPDESNCVPTYQHYLTNPSIWHNWYGSGLGYRQRIVGALPVGTRYHFYKITVPHGITDASKAYFIMIDSGPFKGMELTRAGILLGRPTYTFAP